MEKIVIQAIILLLLQMITPLNLIIGFINKIAAILFQPQTKAMGISKEMKIMCEQLRVAIKSFYQILIKWFFRISKNILSSWIKINYNSNNNLKEIKKKNNKMITHYY